MTLSKKISLKKLEFNFIEDKVCPECHYLYEIQILEDGQLISKSDHREIRSLDEMKQLLNSCEYYVSQEEQLP